jgi:hypothetical protein
MIGAVLRGTRGGVLIVRPALEDAFAMPAVRRHADATCRGDLTSAACASQGIEVNEQRSRSIRHFGYEHAA